MTDQANLGRPCIPCNDSSNEDVSLVICSVRRSDMRPIWRPTAKIRITL